MVSTINIKFNLDLISLFIFMCSYLHILSITTANLGIANRQKWVIVPIILVFLITELKHKNEKK